MSGLLQRVARGRWVSRCSCGALPKSTSICMSMGLSDASPSRRTSRCSAVAVPTTANGQRSRAHNAAKSARRSALTPISIAFLRFVAPDLHRRCCSDGSSLGIARRSTMPPTSESCSNSGIAFDRPPAPTSWMHRIGLSAPSATQRSMTSWQRRSSSGLSRCTDAKSRSSELSPDATDDAAPPPSPISIAGPPSTMTLSPGRSSRFCTSATVHRAQSAGEHDRLVVTAQHARFGRGDLERAEIPAQGWPAKFIVERGGANRSVSHDLECAGHARIQRPLDFP